MNTGYLFTISVIFLQIKILFIKIVLENKNSRNKMNQFCVPNKLKAIKKTSSGLIEKFTIKKNFEFYLRALFNKTFLLFLLFEVT